RGEVDSGSLRKAEGDRPGEAEDEPGADGAVQRARRQPSERLRADVVADAGAARDVGAALYRHRASRRAVLRLDSRPLGARSLLRDAGPDGRQPTVAAEAHALCRRGSGAAK